MGTLLLSCSNDMQCLNSDIHSHVLGIYYQSCRVLCMSKSPLNYSIIKPFSSTLVRVDYKTRSFCLCTNKRVVQLSVLSMQTPLYI